MQQQTMSLMTFFFFFLQKECAHILNDYEFTNRECPYLNMNNIISMNEEVRQWYGNLNTKNRTNKKL